MKNLPSLLITALVAAVVAWGMVQFTAPQSAPSATPTPVAETAPSKLPEKIRCGYVVFPPYMNKDPNTGKLSGIFYDLSEIISEEIGIPLEWTTETSFGTAPADLNYGKFDVLCSAVWADPKRAREVSFSDPLFLQAIMAYGRTGDVRFQGQPLEALIKDTTFKIATLDGDFSNIIQKSKFPTASVLTEPQHVPVSQLAEDVATGKADITFLDRADAHHYIKENPGKIVELPYPPMHLGDDVLAFRKADDELRELFNVAIRKIVHQGTVAEVLEKYDLPAGSYYLPAKPYEEIK